jgi:hypothetical protein
MTAPTPISRAFDGGGGRRASAGARRAWRLAVAGALGMVFAARLAASGMPVVAGHPRVMLTPSIKAALQAKMSAGDPAWLALKAQADQLASYKIFPYVFATHSQEPDNTIFYDYEGSGWYQAALPLGLAAQVSGNGAYCGQLAALADEMVAAQTRPQNLAPNGEPPLAVDDYYPTRFLGPVIGVIYDWCYDSLGAPRRAAMVALMNGYFDDLRAHAYQANDHADGNYFGGHLIAAGFMGYASYGDNPRAQEMIDYARMRLDGTPSALVDPADVPSSHFDQVWTGGYPAASGAPGAPFLGGFDFQGWSYGSGEYERIADYLLAVRSATGEDLIAAHLDWFSQILRAEKEALFPNGFEMDPSGDWGGNQGAVIQTGLPARLAYLLAGSADGPGAQHFAVAEIATTWFPDVTLLPPAAWEAFFFDDSGRPSAALTLPLYYGAFAPAYPQGAPGNGAMPAFIMRSDSGSSATWATAHLGTSFYDDHQHMDAGHLTVAHGNDYLLVDASSWMGAAGSEGIVEGSSEADNASTANTLFFDDYGDYMYTGEHEYYGGQGVWGTDQVVADEQTGDYTYVRSDLSSAYDNASGSADGRRLTFFYRSLVYLRSADRFVVFDQVRAAASTNARGPYRKHVRWHLSNRPAVAGHTATVRQGASRLQLDTLLPAAPAIVPVDESQNPDCDDSVSPCALWPAYLNDSGTWRIEVADPANPVDEPFLTVLQPGDAARPAMTSTLLASREGAMSGALITAAGGESDVVLFNQQAGQTPPPVTSTSYAWSGSPQAIHTLLGMVPGGRYSVAAAGGVVSVSAAAAGTVTASPAGVLRFSLGAVEGCTPGDTTLCIDDQPGDRRYAATVSFATVQGGGLAGAGHAVSLASLGVASGGFFWFFSSGNPEMLIKVLNGCAANAHWWVFYSAGTNVGLTVTVTDTRTGTSRTYTNPDLTPAPPVEDTGALPCP